MKKMLLCLLLIVPLVLTGCGKFEYSSLEDYKRKIAGSGIGYSEVEIDLVEWFLPSQTFLDDYAYTEGQYYYYQEAILWSIFHEDESMPDRVILILNYDEETYREAKAVTLENIPVFRDTYYHYNDYHFYVNQNFMDRFEADEVYRTELTWFTMVGYNDEAHMLFFLGFCSLGTEMPEEYSTDLENHFTEFIDRYYGEYYDFGE